MYSVDGFVCGLVFYYALLMGESRDAASSIATESAFFSVAIIVSHSKIVIIRMHQNYQTVGSDSSASVTHFKY
jgi:hypothetical protein